MSTHNTTLDHHPGLPGVDDGDKLGNELSHVEKAAVRDRSSTGVEGVDVIVPVSHFATLTRAQAFKTFWRSTMFCLMASFGAGMDGYQLSLAGSIVANEGFIDVMASVEGAVGQARIDPQHVAAWGGVAVAGNIIGAFYAPFLADRFGRKFILTFMIFLLLLGNMFELVAFDWKLWAVAKACTGMAVGMTQTQCVIYISEIAVPQIRGFMLSTYALGYGLGGLFSAIALQALAESSNYRNYKLALYTQFITSGIFLAMLWFMPESPWWLANKGRHEKGKKTLDYISGKVSNFDVDHEYSIIVATIEQSRQIEALHGVPPWREMFRGHHLRRLFITAMVSIYCQVSGIALMFGYLTYFLNLVGFDKPFLGSLISNFVLMGAIGVSFWTIERFGRRANYWVTCTVITLDLLLVGILGSIKRNDATNTVLVFLCCLWVAMYALGPAVLAAVYAGEISTPRFRAKTNSFGQGIAQCFALIITYCTPLMLNVWAIKTGYFFAAISFVGGAVLLLTVPETKGRTYAELDELFERGVPALQFAKTRTSTQEQLEEQQQ